MAQRRGEGAEVLLTGATGFLGKLVLHDLLERRESLGIDRVHLLIRPTRSGPEQRFRSEISSSPCLRDLPDDWSRHVRVVPGDLVAKAGLVAATDELSGRITHVVNCAASVDFDLPIEEALAANTTSAVRVLELARRCPRLVSMLSVSTAYVTPHAGDKVTVEEVLAPLPRPAAEIVEAIRSGAVSEDELLAQTRHPNTYTLTKCLAEHLLVAQRGHVPLTLVRPSIISATWRRPFPGWIDSSAAFAAFVMSIATARLHAVVARAGARADIIPCDEVSRRVVDASFARREATRTRIVHAVMGNRRSLPVRDCRAGIESWFQRNPVASTRNGAVRIRYLGPPGIWYRLHHWRHHLRRSDARLVAPKLEQMNERFAYFTSNTFRFRSSAPFDTPGFDPASYLETICRGVATHLLDADLSHVSLAGRSHPAARGALRDAIAAARRVDPRAAFAAARDLRQHAESVTFDLPSFERAVAASESRHVVLAPVEDGPWSAKLLTHLVTARPDLFSTRPRIATAAEVGSQAPPVGERWSWLSVRVDQTRPAAEDSPHALGHVHLTCEEPVELGGKAAKARGPGPVRDATGPLLVTGASGFLGRHLLNALSGTTPPTTVRALVRDVSAWEQLDWVAPLRGVEPVSGSVTETAGWSAALPPLGGIFHLAAIVRHTRRNALELIDTNIEGTLAMVRLAARHRCRLVLVSTSGTVGCSRDPEARPDENAPWCEATVARWPYYRSKLEAERQARALADALGVELVVLRPPVLLGPGDHRFRSTSNVLRALRWWFPFVVGGGMHFADVRDAARALASAMTRPDPKPVYHLEGTICSVETFLGMIEELSGIPAPRRVAPYRVARLAASLCTRLGIDRVPDPVVVEMASHHWGTRSLHASPELGYKSRDPRETLRDTIDWLRAHHPDLRETEESADKTPGGLSARDVL